MVTDPYPSEEPTYRHGHRMVYQGRRQGAPERLACSAGKITREQREVLAEAVGYGMRKESR
jgi:hypothetical protein